MSDSFSLFIKNLSVKTSAGRTILKDINGQIEPGKWLALAGPNGCGKSTLLRSLAGLLIQTSGNQQKSIQFHSDSLFWDGEIWYGQRPLMHGALSLSDLASLRSHEDSQEAPLTNLRVKDLLSLAFFQSNKQKQKELFRIPYTLPLTLVEQQIIEDLDVNHLWNRPFDTLSTGERRLVNLAKSLVPGRSYYFLDEPEMGLDWKHWEAVVNIILERLRENCIVVSSHHLKSFFERDLATIAVLHKGSIQGWGSSKEVLTPHLIEKVWGLKASNSMN